MPQRRSGIQELRLNNKRHLANLDIKTDLKKTVKAFTKLVSEKKNKEAKSFLGTVYKKFDKAVKSRIIEKNTAARRKSRLSKLLQDAS